MIGSLRRSQDIAIRMVVMMILILAMEVLDIRTTVMVLMLVIEVHIEPIMWQVTSTLTMISHN